MLHQCGHACSTFHISGLHGELNLRGGRSEKVDAMRFVRWLKSLTPGPHTIFIIFILFNVNFKN